MVPWADAWVPRTYFSNKPADKSSDSTISFSCSKLNCIFEYRVLKQRGPGLLRNWSLATAPLSFFRWMPKGRHTIQVWTPMMPVLPTGGASARTRMMSGHFGDCGFKCELQVPLVPHNDGCVCCDHGCAGMSCLWSESGARDRQCRQPGPERHRPQLVHVGVRPSAPVASHPHRHHHLHWHRAWHCVLHPAPAEEKTDGALRAAAPAAEAKGASTGAVSGCRACVDASGCVYPHACL